MAPSKVKPEEPEYPPQEVTYLRETPAPLYSEPFYNNYHQDVPIALDIGSSSFKVGLTNSDSPNNIFPSVMARYRYRKKPVSVTIVGNDVYRDVLLKTSIRSPFDGPLVTNWDYLEDMLDYTFEHLGAQGDSQGRLNNPIVMTEPVATPLSHRKNMYELLFEAYQVPKVAFGIDSLFAFHANNSSANASGLVIGTGHESTHVFPVLNGRGILSETKRIDFGGNSSAQFLGRLLGLKYPYFPTKLTGDHTTNLFKDFCYISNNYSDELKTYFDMENLEKIDVVVQAPVDLSAHTVKKKSDEEIAKQLQRKREQGRRLQEQQQQKRLEKRIQKQEELDYFTKVKEELEPLSKTAIQQRVEAEGFEDHNDFNKYVKNLEKTLKSKDEEEEEAPVDPASAWPLVDIPDDQLTEDQIKEKRKQKLLKGNFDARERNKEIQKQEEEARLQREREDLEWRERDLEDWCNTKKLAVAELISKHSERSKLLDSFKDRKSMAAQQRMKNIADLANDQANGGGDAGRKRRRAAATIDNDPTDTFGANDDDWGVYRDITNSSLEEELSEINKKILAIEEDLLKYDPSFHHEDTFAASQTFDWKNSVLHKFIHGPRQNLSVAMQMEGLQPEEIANHPEIILKNHQMHFNVERIRVPEILFQPHIAGLDQAGIIELSNDLLRKRLDGNFSPGGQAYDVLQNIVITGGLARLRNFQSRVANELTSVLPVGAPLKVRTAKDPISDAWKGMSKWAKSEQSKNSYVTRAEWDEYGSEYIKEHGLGNVSLM